MASQLAIELVVSSIVGGVDEQNSIVKNWTAELAITASNVQYKVEWYIIGCHWLPLVSTDT